MPPDPLERWLSIGDLDELIREIDRRCDRADWAGVDEIRRRARAAIDRGHQLWPASSFAEYRLALDAPAEWASTGLDEGAGYMAPGPLTEVVAQNHSWAELHGLVAPSPRLALFAQERVLRGEIVPDEACADMPGRLSDWEPDYVLAKYLSDGSTEFPAPALRPVEGYDDVQVGAGAVTPCDAAEDAALALHGALAHWSTRSGGTVLSSGVEGGVLDAVAALGHDRIRMRACGMDEAAALLAWGASDGGAHGPRRGAATGRFELWWCLAVLAGVEDDWPCDPGGDAAGLEFALWLPDGPDFGWSCRLAVADPEDGLAWALDARDAS